MAILWLQDQGGLTDRRPFAIRNKLRDTGLISPEEHTFITALYALLSVQGGHANMSPQESARIDRQHALTASHFLLLRLETLQARPATPAAGP